MTETLNNRLLDSIPTFRSPVALRGFGGFHVGGQIAHVEAETRAFATPDGETQSWSQSGHFAAGQLYVQAFLPENTRTDVQLQFWHGGGLSGAQWEQTPDGRAGWLQYALMDSFDVIVCDAAERGRAGIPHSKIVNEAPIFRSNELAWHGFRIGPEQGYDPDPSKCTSYEGQKFPVQAFDKFCRQFTARWPGFAGTIQSAYDALIAQSGGNTVIIAHSEGARYALEAARRAPDGIAGLVLIEPAGAPSFDHQGNTDRLSNIPILSVWGDYLEDSQRWQCFIQQYTAYLSDAGVIRHDQIDLNARGSRGHSHFPMLDHGNDKIWNLISDWVSALAKTRCAEGHVNNGHVNKGEIT